MQNRDNVNIKKTKQKQAIVSLELLISADDWGFEQMYLHNWFKFRQRFRLLKQQKQAVPYIWALECELKALSPIDFFLVLGLVSKFFIFDLKLSL